MLSNVGEFQSAKRASQCCFTVAYPQLRRLVAIIRQNAVTILDVQIGILFKLKHLDSSAFLGIVLDLLSLQEIRMVDSFCSLESLSIQGFSKDCCQDERSKRYASTPR
jgi:hypothetical protein